MIRKAWAVLVIPLFIAYVARPVRAAPNESPAGSPSMPASAPNAAPSSPSNSRVPAIILLATGVIAAGAGTFLAVSKDQKIGNAGVQESNLVPVGLTIAAGGVALAMVGTFLWFQVPQTGTRVAVSPSGLVLSGSF